MATVGIDLAKQVFHVYGEDIRGNRVTRKRLSRPGLKQFMASLPSCLVRMEAGPGAHYWGRELVQYGHEEPFLR